eukprot:GHVO01013456.1.p1 GENE.GHVO01013456.1~~GHVO01013456.1.p1  ORF type:complete len:241 (+),score=16.06 GHVO01013456.1:31-753(+)
MTNPHRIYVGNLPGDIKDWELKDAFKTFGKITDIDIKYGKTSNGTAYAFIDFENVKSAEEAADRRHGEKHFGTPLRVELSGSRRPKTAGGSSSKRSEHRVRVTNLPRSASWQDLKDHMRKCGEVGFVSARDGIGYCEYVSRSDMLFAIEKLDGSTFSNPFDSAKITVSEDRSYSSPRRGRSRSRSRSRSPSGSITRSRSRSRRQRSATPEDKARRGRRRSPSPRSRSRSSSYSRSTSRRR